mgnify:CR=1 FL=1
MFIDKPLCHKQAPSERHVVLCFICRSDGAKVLYITFFYKHFTPTGLFFKKLKCYLVSERKRAFCKSAWAIFHVPMDNFKIRS